MPKNVNVPIPETDVEGLGTICFQVEIPDSLLWRRTLYVTIAMLTRGRYWDAKTGVIKDVQPIGWDILSTLKLCDGTTPPDCPSPTEIIRIIKEKECFLP